MNKEKSDNQSSECDIQVVISSDTIFEESDGLFF
jgi:hypothetical protein